MEIGFIESVRRLYELVNADYRLARYERAEQRGDFENMDSSDVHRRFKVRG